MKGVTASDRFWVKVQGGDVSECWEWIAGKHPARGYGVFHDGQRTVKAHRWSYEALIAPIPDGLQIDHLCRNVACVNPWHLEPVTREVNQRRTRRPECGKGHPATPENTYVRGNGWRVCRECMRGYARAAWQQQLLIRRNGT